MVPHVVKMASERRNAFAGLKRSGADLTSNISRRLERLEARAKLVAAVREPHVICFIEPVNKRVVTTLEMSTGKWTHFDPPRERAEFDPMV